jgi:hypothetical protein
MSNLERDFDIWGGGGIGSMGDNTFLGEGFGPNIIGNYS